DAAQGGQDHRGIQEPRRTGSNPAGAGETASRGADDAGSEGAVMSQSVPSLLAIPPSPKAACAPTTPSKQGDGDSENFRDALGKAKASKPEDKKEAAKKPSQAEKAKPTRKPDKSQKKQAVKAEAGDDQEPTEESKPDVVDTAADAVA